MKWWEPWFGIPGDGRWAFADDGSESPGTRTETNKKLCTELSRVGLACALQGTLSLTEPEGQTVSLYPV